MTCKKFLRYDHNRSWTGHGRYCKKCNSEIISLAERISWRLLFFFSFSFPLLSFEPFLIPNLSFSLLPKAVIKINQTIGCYFLILISSNVLVGNQADHGS
ncbi:hypothetical protein BC941DRAFT_208708 [Chlamydoabsidia padenii]|nr:hypothetical protein BC941DRAFT_208708 [Chlamydoabsidia padenii]